jgi:hypothetical protein
MKWKQKFKIKRGFLQTSSVWFSQASSLKMLALSAITKLQENVLYIWSWDCVVAVHKNLRHWKWFNRWEGIGTDSSREQGNKLQIILSPMMMMKIANLTMVVKGAMEKVKKNVNMKEVMKATMIQITPINVPCR